MKRVQCKTCVNDNTVRNISFDNDGVCNFCHSYSAIEKEINDYEELEKNFLKRINKEKGLHKYDVALGISGGKDSTYVLYKLVKEYKLNVIAYTLDNGFMSQEAKDKINSLVNELNVEHEYVICDMKLLQEMYHYIIGKYLSPCIACSYLGYTVMINYASKVDASVGMHGRSIPQMLRGFDLKHDDTFKPFVLAGLKDVEEIDLKTLYESSLAKINNLVDKTLAKKMEDLLLYDAKKNGYRDFIAYFLYHPYDKNEVINYITKNTTWRVKDEEEHFDCLIHNAALYIKNITARRAHAMPELSVMVRQKTITREEALKLAYVKNIKYPKSEMQLLCKYAKLNRTFLLTKAKIYGKRWW